MVHVIHVIAGLAFVAAGAYGISQHMTLAQVKAEIAKIEGEIVNVAMAAEVKSVYAVFVARIKALL